MCRIRSATPALLATGLLLAAGLTLLHRQRVAAAAVEAQRARDHLVGRESAALTDADRLYALVREARRDLAPLLERSGALRNPRGDGDREHGREVGAHGRRGRRGEHERRGDGEHGRDERGDGEHGGARGGERGGRELGGGGGGERGEEGGRRLGRDDRWDATRHGAHLVLAYDARTRSFRGTVRNTTATVLRQVRVEVHLSNGVELGPTRRVDLQPGELIPVELSAAGERFRWWTTHPEHGSEAEHGAGGEHGGRRHDGDRGLGGEEHGRRGGEGRGEHGEGRVDDRRPANPALRPVYNQLLLLREEVRLLARVRRDSDR